MGPEQERPSDEIEDRRSMRGGFGSPGGVRRLPLSLANGRLSLSTIIVLVLIYLAAKMLLGIDILDMFQDAAEFRQEAVPGPNTRFLVVKPMSPVLAGPAVVSARQTLPKMPARISWHGFLVRQSASGNKFSRRWVGNIKNHGSSCFQITSRPVAGRRSPPWAPFTAHLIKRSISI